MLNIRKMTATFGRLEDRTLELQKGLNVISGANESGKSTWTEFILAMFYGIDTRARAHGNQLPVKTQYLPWNGKPMSGRMELEADGKTLILERSSGSAPLSELKVTDSAGTEIAGYHAVRFGDHLLGAEADVYRRSGCLRQQRAAVSADPLLERRLSSLVTTGSEEYAFAEIDGKLKRLQNAVQYNQSGELPRVRSARETAEESLRKTEALREQQIRLNAQISEKTTEEARLNDISRGLLRLEQRAQQDAVLESRAALQQAEEDLQGWEEVCAQLPPQEVLQGLRQAMNEFSSNTHTAFLENGLNQPEMPKAPSDPAFFQLNVHQAREKAEADASFVEEHLHEKKQGFIPLFLLMLAGIAALACGILFLVLNGSEMRQTSPWLIGFGGALAVLAFFLIRQKQNASRLSKQEAHKLLVWYEAASAEEILEKASDYAEAWALYETQQEQIGRIIEARKAQAEELNEQKDALLARFRPYLPECETISDAEMWLQEAGFATASLEQARRSSVSRQAALDRLEKQVRDIPNDEENLSRYEQYDPALIRQELDRCRESLSSLRSEADRISGALEQMGDPLVLHAEIEALEARERKLQDRYEAILLARKALSDADSSLRSRFSPLLCKRTGEIFGLLTEGKYDRISLDRDFSIRIHPVGSTLDRPLAYFSGGTVDQLYLALRLAICDLLLPGKPIILDDALVYFDDNRAAVALKVLKELGKTRQILLFTCQSREKRILDSLNQ